MTIWKTVNLSLTSDTSMTYLASSNVSNDLKVRSVVLLYHVDVLTKSVTALLNEKLLYL